MLPVINLHDSSIQNLTALKHAASDVGFFLLKTDQIDRKRLSSLQSEMERFFSLPTEIKMSVAKSHFNERNPNHYRGFFPSESNQEVYKEGFEFGISYPESNFPNHPFYEGNVWPQSFDQKIGKVVLESYRDDCFSIGMALLRLFSAAFDWPLEKLQTPFIDSISTMRIMHYPALNSQSEIYSSPPHVDSGFITILYQDNNGGLEVEQDGEWIQVEPSNPFLIINFGKLFQLWTDNKVKATMHRVRAPKVSRYSAAFFFEPGFDAKIRSLVDGSDLGTYGKNLKANMAHFKEYDGFLNSLRY